MKNASVYTEFTHELIDQMLGLIVTLSNETRPVAHHLDPGAITDCKNSLLEIGKLVAEKARKAVEVEERLDKCIEHAKRELERCPEESITARLLSTGRLNGYNFIRSWFTGPTAGKLYLARREQMSNDLFWDFVTPDDYEIIKWTGYNDNNWWINVVSQPGNMQRKDKRGRVWELEPKFNQVTLIKDEDK